MRHYAVKDVFATIQGEGTHAGTPAVFLRLAGCNMWSGFAEDRERDAERTGAQCPRWCDTDFTGGAKVTAQEVAAEVAKLLRGQPIVVVTGGEPLLQLDDDLLEALHTDLPGSPRICVETNGTVLPRFDERVWLQRFGFDDPLLWVTMSPKLSRAQTRLTPAHVSELKLVWPDYDPSEWADFPVRFLQPRAAGAIRDPKHERALAALLSRGDLGGWRLSLQTHKILEVP